VSLCSVHSAAAAAGAKSVAAAAAATATLADCKIIAVPTAYGRATGVSKFLNVHVSQKSSTARSIDNFVNFERICQNCFLERLYGKLVIKLRTHIVDAYICFVVMKQLSLNASAGFAC